MVIKRFSSPKDKFKDFRSKIFEWSIFQKKIRIYQSMLNFSSKEIKNFNIKYWVLVFFSIMDRKRQMIWFDIGNLIFELYIKYTGLIEFVSVVSSRMVLFSNEPMVRLNRSKHYLYQFYISSGGRNAKH